MSHLEAIVTGLFWWWVAARFLGVALPYERPVTPAPRVVRETTTSYDKDRNELHSSEVEIEYEDD